MYAGRSNALVKRVDKLLAVSTLETISLASNLLWLVYFTLTRAFPILDLLCWTEGVSGKLH